MSAALPALAPAAAGVGEYVHEQLEQLEEDPAVYLGKQLRKWGAVFLISGVASYFIQSAVQPMVQSYLNDLDRTLDLPQSNPPTPPPPPVPPAYYVQDLATIVSVINGLSPVDPAANLTSLKTAEAAGQDLLSKTPQPPAQTGTDLVTLVAYIQELEQYMGAPVSRGPAGTEYPGTVNWPAAFGMSKDLQIAINAVEVDFGLAATYDVQATPASASGSANNIWDVYVSAAENFAAGLLLGGVVGALLNVSTQGQFVGGAVGALGSGLSGATNLIGNVENGLNILAHGIAYFPRVAWDSLGYAVTWGVSNVLGAIWMPLIIGGISMLAVSYGLLRFWPRLRPRLELGANARLASFWNRFDKRHRTRHKVQEIWTQKSTEGMVASANANPLYVAPVQELPEPEIPVPVPPLPEPPKLLGPPESSEPPKPLGPPEAPEKKPRKARGPPVEPTPTAEVEALLGESPEVSGGLRTPPDAPTAVSESLPAAETPVLEPKEPSEAELAEIEARRKESLPAPEPTRTTVEEPTPPSGQEMARRAHAQFDSLSVAPVQAGGQRIRLTPDEIAAAAEINTDGRRDQLHAAAAVRQDTDERKARRQRARAGVSTEEDAQYFGELEKPAKRRNRVPSWTRTLAMGQGE